MSPNNHYWHNLGMSFSLSFTGYIWNFAFNTNWLFWLFVILRALFHHICLVFQIHQLCIYTHCSVILTCIGSANILFIDKWRNVFCKFLFRLFDSTSKIRNNKNLAKISTYTVNLIRKVHDWEISWDGLIWPMQLCYSPCSYSWFIFPLSCKCYHSMFSLTYSFIKPLISWVVCKNTPLKHDKG